MAIELLDIVAVEDRLARLHRLEKRLYFIEEFFLDYARLGSGGVHVIFEDVPACEDQFVETGKRNEITDLGCAPVGPLPKPHGAHLRERADRLRVPPAHGFHAGNESSCHGSHSGNHDAQLAFCRSYFVPGTLPVFRHSRLITLMISKAIVQNDYGLVLRVELQTTVASTRIFVETQHAVSPTHPAPLTYAFRISARSAHGVGDSQSKHGGGETRERSTTR